MKTNVVQKIIDLANGMKVSVRCHKYDFNNDYILFDAYRPNDTEIAYFLPCGKWWEIAQNGTYTIEDMPF